MTSKIPDAEIELISEEAVEKVSSPETLSIWGLAWPSIMANILFAAVGVVALKAVGALGTEAVAAVGTGHQRFGGPDTGAAYRSFANGSELDTHDRTVARGT